MGTLDDMNQLKNKHIRFVSDLLQDQFGLALVCLENMVRGTTCGAIGHKLIPTPHNLVTSTTLITTYESFFRITPIITIHGRKSSYLGPGGLTRLTASFCIRHIHPRINVGLIRSLAIHARIGHWGSLESPFYEISIIPKKKLTN
ncbi:hypothetical protein UlMin_013451 [Ulmus minor]